MRATDASRASSLTASAPPAARRAAQLARRLQERAIALQTPQEKRQQAELERMMESPHDRATLVQLTDQAFRSTRAARAAEQLTHILDVQGVPRFFSVVERTLLKGFQSFGAYLPGVALPLVKERMREETANVVLPAEPELLSAHLAARRDEGVRMNVNLLGEALLGEREASARLDAYLEALRLPELEVLSVKISTLYSQLSPLAWERSLEVLCERLERLYRAAAAARYARADGRVVRKFVYLDMEASRDLPITVEALLRTLSGPGFEDVEAGIALQAYLPESIAMQRRINDFARSRVAGGGAPLTIRLVKGANLEMERVEASLRGWPQAPFPLKELVDASYKRMLHEGMHPQNLSAVRLGVASHNLFDLAYALVLAAESRHGDHVQLEMLEGMANHERRALLEDGAELLLYAPATRKRNFVHAIGYLVRRLDENTGPDNFLRHAFKLEVGSAPWQELETQFLRSFAHIEELSDRPRRSQDRRAPAPARPDSDDAQPARVADFEGEPDTDFALPWNRDWAHGILERWKPRFGEAATEIPLVVAGRRVEDRRPLRECLDPSRPGVVVARYREASEADLEAALACAKRGGEGWREASSRERSRLLARVAHEIRCARGDLMGAALAETGKILAESDPEVSEAVDFVELYRRSAEELSNTLGLRATGRGVVAVVPPWNFPIAIPCGGVAAALAAGNPAILKPAPESVLVAYELCRCFWRAGIPREALQLLPCAERPLGSRLVRHPDLDTVILTGGTETALAFLRMKPEMNLLAETGGKNATIVSAMADREQAIRHVVQSAFSHAGQKCSATSLLVLEEEVYEDEGFRRMLCDAVESLAVGSAWDPATRVGPLIHAPEGALARVLERLEPGEHWAVAPRQAVDNARLLHPSVKWGVAPGSASHRTELFGPVLGVMKARDLEEAIELVNATGYGLTSGLESLDDREQTLWQGRIRAGNLYVNRPTTGAIVLRQPFGGMGKSAFGPGIQVGGPDYVAQLMRFTECGRPAANDGVSDPLLADLRSRVAREGPATTVGTTELARLDGAIGSYDRCFRTRFEQRHDPARLLGQDNLHRYLPLPEVRVRVHRDDDFFDLFGRVAAARCVGSRITVSVPPGLEAMGLDWLEELTASWAGAIEFVEESDAELATVVREGQTERVRYAAPERVPPEVFGAVRESGQFVARAPVLAEGRIELLWYLRQQTLSRSYHRYGNLGERADEARAEVL